MYGYELGCLSFKSDLIRSDVFILFMRKNLIYISILFCTSEIYFYETLVTFRAIKKQIKFHYIRP